MDPYASESLAIYRKKFVKKMNAVANQLKMT